MKRSEALQGCNFMRNRTAHNERHKPLAGFFTWGVLLSYAMSCCQCQEKTTNESLATHLRHTAMYVQPFLQIGKSSLYLVVRIWHAFTTFFFKRKEVWRIEIQAVHRRTQALVNIVFSTFQQRALYKRVFPFFFPLGIVGLEVPSRGNSQRVQ